MTPQEFIAIRKELDLSKTELGKKLGFANPYLRVHSIEEGKEAVSTKTELLMKQLIKDSFKSHDTVLTCTTKELPKLIQHLRTLENVDFDALSKQVSIPAYALEKIESAERKLGVITLEEIVDALGYSVTYSFTKKKSIN